MVQWGSVGFNVVYTHTCMLNTFYYKCMKNTFVIEFAFPLPTCTKNVLKKLYSQVI